MIAPIPALAVVVDTRLEEPVYVQIARQIREAIVSGALAAGAALPGVRTLASDLGLNLNTVARAYRALEEEGFVEIRSRTGVRVASPAEKISGEARERFTGELRVQLARMRQAGFAVGELRRVAMRSIAALAAAAAD
jgi:GntR family transcriptional regulator